MDEHRPVDPVCPKCQHTMVGTGKGLVLLHIGKAREVQIYLCDDCGTIIGFKTDQPKEVN